MRFVLLPRTLVSKRLWTQIFRIVKFFPKARFKISFQMIRSWGQEASIHLTSRFNAPLESARITGPHPEIEALKAGGTVLEKFVDEMLQKHGITDEGLEDRLNKTRKLMKADYEELFSEVSVNRDGSLFIHDGYHRAGLAIYHGLDYFHAVVSVPVDLR